MKDNDKTSTGRRSFLKLAGVGIVGGGAAVVATAPSADAAAPAAQADGQYRETDHVKRYYELAKFI